MIAMLSAVLAGLVAGLVKGMTGFGFALVFVPVLSLIIGPKAAVGTSVVLGTLSDAMVLYQARTEAPGRTLLPMILVGLVGTASGAYLLWVASAAILKVLIGTVVVLLALLMIGGVGGVIRRERLASTAVGFAGGALTAATGMGGPPVILFFVNQGYTKNAFRARFSQYFVPVNFMAAAFLASTGILNRQTLTIDVLLLPIIWLGIIAGGRLLHRVPAEMFRKLVLAVVIVAGLVNVVQGVRVLVP
ncbi:MAG: sulfite exporter TauE/SafE family protein [Ardenticatenaceae bacterium]|nr:sulfite exporter TauE/SafE family protein [Ardenticatenaceae bacterium]